MYSNSKQKTRLKLGKMKNKRMLYSMDSNIIIIFYCTRRSNGIQSDIVKVLSLSVFRCSFETAIPFFPSTSVIIDFVYVLINTHIYFTLRYGCAHCFSFNFYRIHVKTFARAKLSNIMMFYGAPNSMLLVHFS